MANTPLVTCRAVLFETAYYHYYFFVSLLLFFYFYYFDVLSRFSVVPGGSGWVPVSQRIWTPRGFGLPGPNPLADLDPLRGFGPPTKHSFFPEFILTTSF